MVMKERGTQVISDTMLITGFFREALFQSRTITIKTHADVQTALITDLEEPDTRNTHCSRFLILSLANTVIPEDTINGELRCHFPHFLASWTGSCIRQADGQYKSSIPESIRIENSRDSRRTRSIEKLMIQVVIQTGGLHTIERLEIEDFSATGLGGIIRSSSGIPISQGSLVRGIYFTRSGPVKINGTIQRISLLESPKYQGRGETIYRVGIAQTSTIGAPPPKKPTERRRVIRKESRNKLVITSAFNPRHAIDLELREASVVGFSATPVDPADSTLLPAGCGIRISESSLIAEVIAVQDGILRFQILDGTTEDRINWIKNTASLRPKNVASQTGHGTDLIDLFCNAGAVSSGYLKTQTAFAEKFREATSVESPNETWIHRWIERDNNGETRGHVSAIRIADTTWHLGDIAGSRDSNLKISNSFIPDFLSSFSDFCLSTSPCPKILIGWKSGHKYWGTFEKFIESDGKQYLLSKLFTRYYRYETNSTNKNVQLWKYRKIESSEFALIQKIHQSVPEHARCLLLALDLSCETFGSSSLKNAIKLQTEFKREYGILENGSSQFLIVYNHFPPSASLNKTMNVPWVFGLHGNCTSIKLTPDSEAALRLIGYERGFEFPGYLEVLCEAPEAEIESTKLMTWILGHPRILDVFKVTK